MVLYHYMQQWSNKSRLAQSERIYRLLNPSGDPFRYDSSSNIELELIGLTLWATEGDKTQVSLANGNPFIIQKYLKFLREICHLKEEKMRIVLHCHDTLPYQQCIRFWSGITGIPASQFKKPYIKKDKGGTRKYPYGICRIAATNTKLVQKFNERLAELNLTREYDYEKK